MPNRIKKICLFPFKHYKLTAAVLIPLIFAAILLTLERVHGQRLAVAVLNNDRGGGGAEIISRLTNTGAFLSVSELKDVAQIRTALADGATAILTVPENMTQSLLSGKPSRLQLILNADNTAGALIARGHIQWAVQNFNAQLGSLNRDLPLATVVLRYWYNENLSFKWYALPAAMVILSFAAGWLCCCMFLPAGRGGGIGAIMIKNVLPATAASAAAAIMLVYCAVFIFRIPPVSDMAAVFKAAAAFCAAVTASGFLLYGAGGFKAASYAAMPAIWAVAAACAGMFAQDGGNAQSSAPMAAINPVSGCIRIMRYVFMGEGDIKAVNAAALTSAVFAAVMLTAALFILHLAPRRKKFSIHHLLWLCLILLLSVGV